MSDKKIFKVTSHTSEENHQYVHEQAKALGISASQYVHELIDYIRGSDKASGFDPVMSKRVEEFINTMAPEFGFEKQNQSADSADQHAMFLRCVAKFQNNGVVSTELH